MWESTKMWRKSGKQIGRTEKLENGRMKNEEDYKGKNNKMEEWSKRKCKMEQWYKNDSWIKVNWSIIVLPLHSQSWSWWPLHGQCEECH